MGAGLAPLLEEAGVPAEERRLLQGPGLTNLGACVCLMGCWAGRGRAGQGGAGSAAAAGLRQQPSFSGPWCSAGACAGSAAAACLLRHACP